MSLLNRLPAACPPGVDPCNDTGPSPTGSHWLVPFVVIVTVAAVVCVALTVAYLRSRHDR